MLECKTKLNLGVASGGCGYQLNEWAWCIAAKINGSGFVCLAICGGKERIYHSSSRKIVKVGWESNFGELLGKVDQELALSLFLLSSIYAQMLAKWLIFFFFFPLAGSLVKTEKSVNHFIQLVWP